MDTIDQRLRDYCAERHLTGLILRRRSNMAWASGGADFHCDTASTFGIATLVWTPQRKLCLTDTIEAPRLRDEEPLIANGWDIEPIDWWDADSRIESFLCNGAYECDVPDDRFYELRATLTPAEIDRARTLGQDTAQVVERLLHQDVRPGMTEHHLGGAVAGWLRDRGIAAHVVLVAADERIARYRHPIPTGRAIERCAMVAVCAQRHGLIVSLTRLVHFGPIDPETTRRHAAVIEVDRALHAATSPGTQWCHVLAAGIHAYERTGFSDQWRLHHQGGPMGYEARDFKATPTETRRVHLNQLVGWNPSISGTKSEDTLLVHAQRNEIITHTGEWPMIQGRPAILQRP
jgi:antitoxin VapB